MLPHNMILIQQQNLIWSKGIHNYKPNNQPINSSIPFVCLHTVLHVRIRAELWHAPLVSPHCHLSAATRWKFQQKRITAQPGNADYSMLETRTCFGKLLPVFPLWYEIKNTCGFENVTNHNNNSWQLLEGRKSGALSQHTSALSEYTLPTLTLADLKKHTKPSTRNGRIRLLWYNALIANGCFEQKKGNKAIRNRICTAAWLPAYTVSIKTNWF